MSAGRRRPPILLLAVLTIAACGDPRERLVVHDLVEGLAYARASRETAHLDIGTEAARPHLLTGWSRDERTRKGETFAWATGTASEVELELLRPRDLTISFRLRPYRAPGHPPGALVPSVNGRQLEEIPLRHGTHRYFVALTSEWLRSGVNRLTLRHRFDPQSRSPRAMRGGRPLAEAWFDIRVDDRLEGDLPPAVLPARAGRALAVPWDGRVDYFLRLPAGAELSFTGLETVGEGEGILRVALRPEGGAERQLGTATPGDRSMRFRLLEEDPTIVQLSLQAVPSETPREHSGLVLIEPRIDAPPIALASDPAPAPTQSVERRRPNILIYLVDTLRADRLGCYGYPRPVSPAIDGFAAQAALFERAVGNTSWTRPAVTSLFTGLWPPEHGVQGGRDKLSSDAVTLAEYLSEAGYSTASIVANPNAGAGFGLDQGFDHHVFRSRLSDWIFDQAVAWLESRPSRQPFFLYLHTKDPHDPYDPPAEERARFAPDVPPDFPTIPEQGTVTPALLDGFQRLYDGDVAFNDRQFARLIGLFEELGLYDDLLIVFLADHGEEFQEHGGWLHGTALWREQLDVPLLIRLPGQVEGARISTVAQQIDILPTLLDYLGIEAPVGGGRSLLPVIEDPARSRERPAFGHLARGDGPTQLSVSHGRWKLIQKRRGERAISNRLFDLAIDPGEIADVANSHPVTAGYLASLLERRLHDSDGLTAGVAELSQEEEAELRALGYLQ